jgi:glycosyltransferase involved in cell wall biosynthesis
MRVLVHDFGGYPFIVQLSRELARRGNEILHLTAAGFRHPKGPMEPRPNDAATLVIEALSLDEPLRRDGIARLAQERRYRHLLTERIARWRPDAVISANTPLEVQDAAAQSSRAIGAAFVFWLQDLHSVAVSRIVARRFPILGPLIATRFTRLEQRLLRQANAVVAIADDYVDVLRQWGLPLERVVVVENWAPLEDLPPRHNEWSARLGLDDGPVVLYAGTLALKHNPALLLSLAQGIPAATVIVVAEGQGADWLRARTGDTPNLRILDFQPYAALPSVLASSDLLVAVLEPDASAFSAPSKVLTYLAAGRAILAAIPADNAAARLIVRTRAGIVVEPTDTAGLVSAARKLLSAHDRRLAAAEAGRAYALRTFDIRSIADRFEATLARAISSMSHPSASTVHETSR